MQLRVLYGTVILALAWAMPVTAQTGTLTGRVLHAQTSTPLQLALVLVVDANGGEVTRGTTRESGLYRLTGIPSGTYSVRITSIGFSRFEQTGVVVSAGATVTVDATLTPEAYIIPEVTTTASRTAEKVLDAPASVSVVSGPRIAETPALTITDYLKEVPGVNISQGGLLQSNVVARGFNNVFSGAMLMLVDNRYASVPSLRVNIPAFFPVTNEDVERIEVVLGPGAALYGPNAANGVLNIITKSPFASQGTTVSVETGERDLVRTGFRHAYAPSDKFAYKISGEWMTGDDWRFKDNAEPETPGRDFRIKRFGGEARVDVRPDANTLITGTYGLSKAVNLIDLTGLGAGQVKGWKYQNFHTRLTHKRLFVQAFLNTSDAGDTRLLRTGERIVDESRLWTAQFQHGFDIGRHQTFLYGADYIFTDARTGGTINGRNEEDDDIKEIGGYLHSVTRFSPQWELVSALRVDKHSRLSDAVFSPRAAIVFKPSEEQNIRFTYNRAFSTPSNNNLFLDIVGGQAGPFTVRALGVPRDGFSFRGFCGAGGVDNLCMRTPFVPNLGVLPANAASLWAVAVGAVCPAIGPACTPLMNIPAPTSAQVGTQLRVLNPSAGTFADVAPGDVVDVSRLEPTITNTLELGYKAIVGGRASITVDAWYEKKENFVGPLIVETPNVFLNTQQTIAYLTPFFGPTGAAQIGTAMAGLPGGTSAAGTTGVPLGTVVPDGPFGNSPDIVLTYRNFGDVDLYGLDFAGEVALDRRFTLAGTWSWVSDDFFPRSEVGGVSDIALNSAQNKGSFSARFRDDQSGWSAEARVRGVESFPVNSGVFVGESDGYVLFDAQVAYRFARKKAMISVNAQNLFDRDHATFVGVPKIGRLVSSKVQYTF